MFTDSQGSATFKCIHQDTPEKHSSAYKSTQYASAQHPSLHQLSPQKSLAVSRLQDARRTIDSVIEDLTDKK